MPSSMVAPKASNHDRRHTRHAIPVEVLLKLFSNASNPTSLPETTPIRLETLLPASSALQTVYWSAPATFQAS